MESHGLEPFGRLLLAGGCLWFVVSCSFPLARASVVVTDLDRKFCVLIEEDSEGVSSILETNGSTGHSEWIVMLKHNLHDFFNRVLIGLLRTERIDQVLGADLEDNALGIGAGQGVGSELAEGQLAHLTFVPGFGPFVDPGGALDG